MSEWSSGYVTEIGYTYGYYAELNPARARFALHSAGIAAPKFQTACELGFGQGVSVNVHAATSTVRWYGTDFNPSQALFASQLSQEAGAGAVIADQAFAEFCARPDLPDFDYIGLHGIWTWISDENRAVIVDFVRRKLKLGGVLYVSYNVLPGWSPAAPLRHLLAEHGSRMSASGGGIVPRINSALDFAEKLFEVKPAYMRAVPGIAERLKKLKEQNRQYLAHEYFNRDWKPMYFADMERWLEPARVSFASSANYTDLVPMVNLTKEQQAVLASIPDAGFRETVRDYMNGSQFRRDYWIKGERRLTVLEQSDLLRQQRVMLVTPRSAVTTKIAGAQGEASLQADLHEAVLDALVDHQPRSIAEIERVVTPKGHRFAQVMSAILLLIGKNDLSLVQDTDSIEKAQGQCAQINAALLARSRANSDISVLASPVTGGAVAAPYLSQMLLLGHQRGLQSTEELAQHVWGLMKAVNRKMLKDKKQLEGADENLAELRVAAQEFISTTLPILKSLKIA